MKASSNLWISGSSRQVYRKVSGVSGLRTINSETQRILYNKKLAKFHVEKVMTQWKIH